MTMGVIIGSASTQGPAMVFPTAACVDVEATGRVSASEGSKRATSRRPAPCSCSTETNWARLVFARANSE